ncbi:MAG: hypothetical protein ACFFG0_21580 [Candidatus Thorarchaeota archaeon]
MEIIDDIYPLITQLLDFAEERHSFLYLAEEKLLQAKVALIQMNIEEAKLLFTQAQKLVDSYGFDLLAMKISSEHDIFLEKVKDWDDLKEKNAPISERMKLASLDGVIDRIQRKRAVDPLS